MAIGVSKKEFYHSTLAGLIDYDEAYSLRRKIEDEQSYFQGIYTYEAVSTVIQNAFRSKGSQPIKYRDKGIMQQIEDQQRLLNPTEEEKKKYTEDLYAMLGQMQSNFERTHGGE